VADTESLEEAERAAPAPARPARLRLSRRGVVVLTALCGLLLAGLAWLVLFSPVLAVRTVAVSGTRVLTPAQVTVAAQVPMGHSLALLDTGAIRGRVAALPRVASVRVGREWPGTVRISVTERTPIAAVLGADGRYAQVDAGGTAFATGRTAPAGVPVVRVELSAAGRSALGAFPQPLLVAAAVQVTRDLPPSLARGAGAVTVRSYDDIEVRLANGATVLWGSPDRGARKAVVLEALLKQHGTVYDVSAPDAPAVSG
jgi:cell division protein FtsQ